MALLDPAGVPGALLYHRDAVYLLDRFGVPLQRSIEAVSGVAPGAGHLSRLSRTLAGRRRVVIHVPYQSVATAQAQARDLGWPVVLLPFEPPAGRQRQRSRPGTVAGFSAF